MSGLISEEFAVQSRRLLLTWCSLPLFWSYPSMFSLGRSPVCALTGTGEHCPSPTDQASFHFQGTVDAYTNHKEENLE